MSIIIPDEKELSIKQNVNPTTTKMAKNENTNSKLPNKMAAASKNTPAAAVVGSKKSLMELQKSPSSASTGATLKTTTAKSFGDTSSPISSPNVTKRGVATTTAEIATNPKNENDGDDDTGDESFKNPNIFQRIVANIDDRLGKCWERNGTKIKLAVYAILAVGYHAYFVAAMVVCQVKKIDKKHWWPLVAITAIGWLLVIYYFVYLRLVKKLIDERIWPRVSKVLRGPKVTKFRPVLKWLLAAAIVVGILVFLIVDVWDEPFRLVSLLGIFVFMLFGFLFSKHTARIKWRPVLSGLFVQFIFCLIMFRVTVVLDGFAWVSERIVIFLEHTYNGTAFVYGFTSNPPNICGLSLPLLFTVFQVITFFGAMVNVLYYFGVIQWFLLGMASIMRVLMGTTAAESLVAVASTLLGQSEAPFMIKPYLAKMTKSELHQIMASGYASIAGSLFAAYIGYGACPQYLLSASIMSCPVSTCVSKLLYPETEKSRTKNVSDLHLEPSPESSAVEALSNGASATIMIVAGVGANLIVFIATIAFLNTMLAWAGSLVGIENLSLELMYSYLFFPFAYVMGPSRDLAEVQIIAELIGTKTVLNEFLAYRKMSEYLKQGKLSKRAQMIATYALCGFSNFASIGIQIGALTGMCPEKKDVIPELAVRALLAGSLSGLVTASFAGLLSKDPATCPPVFDHSSCVNLVDVREFMNTTKHALDACNVTIDYCLANMSFYGNESRIE